MERMKISVLMDIFISQFYGYIGKYQWVFQHKTLMGSKLIKTHGNIRKTLQNDRKSNNRHFEIVY